MAPCERSLLVLKMSKPLFVIIQYFDEIFMQSVYLSQRFSCTCFNLMSPPDERLGYFDAEMPQRSDYRKCRTNNRQYFGCVHLSMNKWWLAFRLGCAGGLGGMNPPSRHQATGNDGCFLDDVS
jgi:hypothetical protein